ncbi:PACE efflux transporter [Vibrio sp. Of7-15]|uniref:PACE efflux transporter n=1 Tax=Vibrio sp. Of7-15 TaxID=2724879 RepID=UPI001EF37BFD|nr:PACE efflux transporter [Vibrio sp. Of7-15]MCG7495670.1 PACE efflux transporter [Vibrio sp. Of7-15]
MRTTADRIRHAIAFEIIGLVLMIGILSQFGFELAHVGMMGLAFSIIATVWNYVYNIGFDNFMMKKFNSTEKSLLVRVFHSIGFEAGLLIITIPAIAWMLDLSLWNAFLLDMGMVVFYLIYAYVYNLAYDKVFPVNQQPAPNAA